MFIFIIQLLQNLESVDSAFCNPFVMTRSSAYRGQFRVEPFGSNMGSVSCLNYLLARPFFLVPTTSHHYAGLNKTKPQEDWKRDEVRLWALYFHSTVYRWKRLPQATLFFFVTFVDIWLRTELKAVEAGKWKKKKRKKKNRYDETKDDGKQKSPQISFCYFYKRQLLIVKFVFFFLEKAEIGHKWCYVKHDSASNQDRLHAWWASSHGIQMSKILSY